MRNIETLGFICISEVGPLEESTLKVLVVDDYEPFRRFVRSTLTKMQNLKVIGEASDGLEAVRKAEELQPDLIVLDIGLPTLNGIEVARQVRNLRPQCKIIFMSQESSAAVAQEALSLGAMGYVVKSYAGIELSAAVEEVCQGGLFISKGLSGYDPTDVSLAHDPGRLVREVLPSLVSSQGKITHSHEGRFYPDDAALLLGGANFIEAALKAGRPVIVVATESHRKGLLQILLARGINTAAAMEEGLYLALDIYEALSTLMVHDLADSVRYLRFMSDLVSSSARAAKAKHARVAFFGEIAATLWARGNADAAIQIEQATDELAKTRNVEILCGYVLNSFQREHESHIYERICANHSAVSSL